MTLEKKQKLKYVAVWTHGAYWQLVSEKEWGGLALLYNSCTFVAVSQQPTKPQNIILICEENTETAARRISSLVK